MSLYVFATLGVFLLAAPWSPVWDFATTVLLPTSVGNLVRSGFARGAISGLGCLDLLVAIQEAEHLRRILKRSPATTPDAGSGPVAP
jgi:hypothetical protein